MEITTIQTYLVPLARRKNWLLVKLQTKEGISGWGEAYTQLDRELAVAQYVEQLSRYSVGRSAFNIKHFTQTAYDDFLWRRGTLDAYCALSAIEQAMWDAVGKAMNQPVYNLLGGPCRSKIRLYANGWFWGAESPSDFARAAEATVREGFSALKVYPFSGPTRSLVSKDQIKRALEIMRAVRTAIGPEVDLLVDLRRRLAPIVAMQFVQLIEEFDPYWIEEPCPYEDLSALARIRASTSIPIATGESFLAKRGFRPVFEKRAADIVMPDVASVGGILEAKEIAAMAEPQLVAVAPHNYNSTTVALAATVHASAVMPNYLIAEYFLPFADDGRKISKQLEPLSGYITLPEEPGLGIQMNEAALATYSYKQFPKREIPIPSAEGP